MPYVLPCMFILLVVEMDTLCMHAACMKRGTPCMSIVHTPAVGGSERKTPCLSIDG